MLMGIKTFIGKITSAKILAILLAAGIFTVAILAMKLTRAQSERDRYHNNYEVLNTGLEQIIIADSLRGVKIRQLELDKEELREYYDGELMKTLKDMDIRLRKMEGFSTVATETENNINTFFRDTVIRDTVRIEKLEYRSRWFDIDIIKQGQEANIRAFSRDSLIQVVYWDRKGFWPLKWTKKKEYFQNIISANPDSRITYSRYIVPERKRTK